MHLIVNGTCHFVVHMSCNGRNMTATASCNSSKTVVAMFGHSHLGASVITKMAQIDPPCPPGSMVLRLCSRSGGNVPGAWAGFGFVGPAALGACHGGTFHLRFKCGL